jgi:hypothetical protein
MSEQMITITAARLAELEAAEERLKLQRSKNTEHVKQSIDKDRQGYNARRRELYRLKKVSAATGTGVD